MICFIVDARDGLVHEDLNIAKKIRRYKKDVLVVVNKIDGLNFDLVKLEFYSLGFSNIHAISATNGIGIKNLVQDHFLRLLSGSFKKNKVIALDSYFLEKRKENIALSNNFNIIKIAIVGKPNVGKSTLVNKLLNTNRMIIDDQPGTTRDSIWSNVVYKKYNYIFADTAGIRRKNKVTDFIEQFSVKKSLNSIKFSNVVILMLDATDVISDQDIILFNYIINYGCGIIIIFNKCDQLSKYDRKNLVKSKKLKIMNIGMVHFISAMNGLGVNKIFTLINQVFHSSMKKLSTSTLTEIMKLAVEKHQPPIVKGNKIKLKYAHVGKQNPLTIIIHGKKLNYLSCVYKKYISNYFKKELNLIGNPIHFYFKNNSSSFLK
ncbi:MAG: ribosome biogenesis GTPase Der [Buchnera aphidicola (Kaburagia rhusicola rhusicola)]